MTNAAELSLFRSRAVRLSVLATRLDDIGSVDTIAAGSAPPAGGAPAQIVASGDDLSGQTIGQYRLERKLGRGNMGEVYLALHKELGGFRAVKILRFERTRVEEYVEQVRHEARMTNRLREQAGIAGVAVVHDVDQAPDGRWYMVMEYLDGHDLGTEIDNRCEEWCRRHRWKLSGGEKPPAEAMQFPVREAAAIVREVALIMHRVHEQGILHRDLKPDNIFFVKKNGQGRTVKVVDFGFALDTRALRVVRDEEGLVGTPVYMSPEQAARKPATVASEVYTLAVILYELVSGRWPHEHCSQAIESLLVGKQRDTPPPASRWRPDLPVELVRLLGESLAIDPRRRPQGMEVFAERLRQAVEPPRPTFTRSRRRRRLALPLSALLSGVSWGAWLYEVPEPAREAARREAVQLLGPHVQSGLEAVRQAARRVREVIED